MGYSSSMAEPPACLAGGASPRLSVRGRIASSSKPIGHRQARRDGTTIIAIYRTNVMD